MVCYTISEWPFGTDLYHLLSLLYPLGMKAVFLWISHEKISMETSILTPEFSGSLFPAEELLQRNFASVSLLCLFPSPREIMADQDWRAERKKNDPFTLDTTQIHLLKLKCGRSHGAFVESETFSLCHRNIFAHFQAWFSYLTCSLLFSIYIKGRLDLSLPSEEMISRGKQK